MKKVEEHERTKVIGVRLPYTEWLWINDLSRSMKIHTSTLVKLMIDYFLMAHAVGLIKTPMSEVRKEFVKTMQNIIKSSKNGNKHIK